MIGRRTLILVTVLIGALVACGTAASAASADTLAATCTSGGTSAPCSSTTWYGGGVDLVWTTDTPPDAYPQPSCILDAVYQYTANSPGNPISCSASWSDGTTVIKTYTLHIETSAPSISSTVSGQPDSDGWYTHPVQVTFSGSAFSGIRSCTAPTSYSGQAITGSCTDNAGKIASTTVSLKYDPTPPTITGATPSRAPDYHGWYTKPVSFTFDGSDLVSGIQSCQTVKYRRSASGWVTGGCWNKAGNYSSMKVWVRRLPVLGRAPARVASAPLLMRWRSVRHASYYNIQLYRGNRKLLSRWPSGSSLFLARTWRFDGRRLRLKWGRYRWYVWPGYGSRAADRYGRIVLSATFFVT